ncbi:hypothetical protein ACPCK5_16410 [Streptomyces pseudogriseolus]|uniref:hypothetical protein n=1 Tax=Streptomyces pseudogriseolus TaxID=36817 RepID=UPI001E5FB176
MSVHANRGSVRRVRAAWSAAVAVCAVTALSQATPAAAGQPEAAAGVVRGSGAGVERISVAPDGTQADGDSVEASITTDGNRVVFVSTATNLVSGGTAADKRVYLRDQRTGQITQLGHHRPSGRPALSGDGEYVAWPEWFMDFVHIRLHQVRSGGSSFTRCVLVCDSPPSLSGDGRYIAAAGRNRTGSDVVPHRRLTVEGPDSVETIAEFDHYVSPAQSISGDGRRVAYQDGRAHDVFVWERTNGVTSGPIEGPSVDATFVQLSEDGRKVVYLVGDDTYVHDLETGDAEHVPGARGVAVDPTGRCLLYTPNGGDGPSLVLRDLRTGTDETVAEQPATAGPDAVSAGGRDVVFQSAADGIVPDDTNGASDVFVRRFH